jgi:hypothetical protein
MIASIIDKSFILLLTACILTVQYFCFESAINLGNKIQENEAKRIMLDSLMIQKGKNPCLR